MGAPDAEPRLVFLGRDSSSRRGVRLVREMPRGVIVDVKTRGTFVLEIVSADPRQPLSAYKLRSAFDRGIASPSTSSSAISPWVERKDVDEEDCDILEISSQTFGMTLMAICTAVEGAEPYRLGRHFVPCDLVDVDDHGDTPHCATPVVVDESTAGEIVNAAGDDEDFFTFVLEERRSGDPMSARRGLRRLRPAGAPSVAGRAGDRLA